MSVCYCSLVDIPHLKSDFHWNCRNGADRNPGRKQIYSLNSAPRRRGHRRKQGRKRRKSRKRNKHEEENLWSSTASKGSSQTFWNEVRCISFCFRDRFVPSLVGKLLSFHRSKELESFLWYRCDEKPSLELGSHSNLSCGPSLGSLQRCNNGESTWERS